VKARTLVFTAVMLAAGAAGFGAAWWWRAHAVEELVEIAPALNLKDLDGKPLSLADWKGKVVLVNFWATWCAPCMDELPMLVQTQAEFGPRGLQIVGPAMDDAAAVKPMLARFGINYPVGADYSAVDAAMRAFGNDAGALPYSVLISRDGHVVQRILGALHAADLKVLLEQQVNS
jgi:thiol-disulfide isomerase/thioredoxin